MTKPLFISYSTADTATTEQIRGHLEAQGIACWMASRDIAPGEDYAEQIINAIEGCTVLLLVLSESSNHSQYVQKEVERAIAKRKVVIPFRIHDVTPSRSLEFFISNAQWIDARQPPLTAPLSTLVGALHNHLYGRAEDEPAPSQPYTNAPGTPAPPAFLINDAQLPAQESHFVAREAELRQLDGFLARALNGQGQVVFVAGEAGAGKSALVQAFAHQAQAHHAELIVAGGAVTPTLVWAIPTCPSARCSVCWWVRLRLAGWRAEIIPTDQARRLWRFATQTLAALANGGPDLVDTLVAGTTILRQTHALAPTGTVWHGRLEQLVSQRAAGVGVALSAHSNLFYQCSQVLNALAQVQPLLLLLDDLHWADSASLQLLFHLARQLKTSRVLIVGAYRPEDVALGRDGERHPLEPILNELKRADGNIVVDLATARTARGQVFVDALLDTEPHHLSAAFRQALYARTEGHPLFTVEVLRNLQERGDLSQDADGNWIESATLDWATLPARVEGVIAERVARLGDDRRSCVDLLLAREAVYDLQGAREAQKKDLEVLEQLATALGDAGLQAVVLGRRAHYARLTSDYPTAIAAARQALVLAEIGNNADAAIEAMYEWAETLFHQGDYTAAAAQADKGLTRSRTLGDHRSTMRCLNTLGNIAGKQGDFATAQAHFLQLLAHARTLEDRLSECRALANLGVVAGSQSDDATACIYFEQSLTLATMLGERRHESVLLLNLGLIANRQGDYTAARQALDQSLSLTRLIGDRQNESISLLNLSSVAGHQGDYIAALMYAQQALAITQMIGDPDMEAWARLGEGHAHLGLAQFAAAAVAYQAAINIRLTLNQPHMLIEPRAGLARVALAQQELALALTHVESILAHVARHTVDGADEPLLVYWTCYQTLQVHADLRAPALLQRAYELIQASAAKIEDAALRRSYLENVAVHRAIMQEWQAQQAHR